jgi:hypothetical protein
MSQDHVPSRLWAIRRLPPAAALRGNWTCCGGRGGSGGSSMPRRRDHLVAGLRGPPLHAGLPSMGGPPGALLAGRPATETQPPGSAAASSEGGGLASRCPPERRERIVGAVTLKERPREVTRFTHRATAPPRLPSPDPRGGSEQTPDLRRLSRGPKARAARPLRPRPRVAARLRASRPSRCRFVRLLVGYRVAHGYLPFPANKSRVPRHKVRWLMSGNWWSNRGLYRQAGELL